MEIWYDMEIQMRPKVDKNRPDIVIWEKAGKKCTLVEITVPLDNNLQKAHKEKETKYINLISSNGLIEATYFKLLLLRSLYHLREI